MSWDGNGTFSRTNGTNTGAETWQDDDAAGTDILSDRHDTHDQDLADGIAACLTKNNETRPTAHFRPNVDNSYDLGSSSLGWVDAYLKGVAYLTGVVFTERADHPGTPEAGKGIFWTRDDAPCSPQFTDDSGTDHSLTIQLGTEQASTTGTSISFTGIPSGAKRVTISFIGVSLDGSNSLWIQLGDSGGVETSGYLTSAYSIGSAAISSSNETSGFEISSASASRVWHGHADFVLEDPSDFTWTGLGWFGRSDSAGGAGFSGSKSLSAELDRIAVVPSGSDNFDAGAINISWSF